MLKAGDIIEGVVLEVKEDSVVIKFGLTAIEAEARADLKAGQEVRVRVKGWYQGKLLLKVLGDEESKEKYHLDIKV